jgi:hypothetical protein
MAQQPSVEMEHTASARVVAGPVHIMEVSQNGSEIADIGVAFSQGALAHSANPNVIL